MTTLANEIPPPLNEDELGYDKESLDVRLLITLASVILGATVIMTFAQVVLRFVFNNPQAWAEEVLRRKRENEPWLDAYARSKR